MFMTERQNIIYQLIKENGAVTVAELVKKFSVSDETVRRDLKHLEDDKLLKRVHGGAISVVRTKTISNYTQRLDENSALKYELSEYQDIEIRNMAAERLAQGYSMDYVMASIHAKGRDNARTPMQWDDSENAGFTSGKPWLKVNPNYRQINVAAQQEGASILNYYRNLIALRKREDVIRDGDYQEILPEREDVFAYSRSSGSRTLTVIANFTGKSVDIPAQIMENAGKPEIYNYPQQPGFGKLRPYEAVMYLK